MKKLEDFVRPTQKELFRELSKMYQGAVVSEGNYILVPGAAPIMLLAHMDTVHKKQVQHICKTQNGNILMSPQGIGGDDRCGVFALVTAHARAETKPWLLFTCDEEVGGIGAGKFCGDHKLGFLPKELDELKILVEIDRKGRTDAVYYDCDNADFEKYITSKGFKTEWGSFSDISVVAPELGVAAVNLSSGYYNAHTLHEFINRKHLNGTVRKVGEIIADAAKPDLPKYEYIKGFGSGLGSGWEKDDRGCFGGGYRREYVNPYRRPDKTTSTKKSKKKTPAAKVMEPECDSDLEGVPEEIRHEFKELLAWYSPDELNKIRLENGDWAIRSLYEAETGQRFEDIEDGDNYGALYMKGGVK